LHDEGRFNLAKAIGEMLQGSSRGYLWTLGRLHVFTYLFTNDKCMKDWQQLLNKTRGHSMTTTTEIADKIAAEQGLTKIQAKAIVELVFKAITDAAAADAETSIPGFGKFKVKATPEREGRNPGTGEKMKIAASKKLAFTPAKALKDALNA
jgi:DNA-binding protein HU-beta